MAEQADHVSLMALPTSWPTTPQAATIDGFPPPKDQSANEQTSRCRIDVLAICIIVAVLLFATVVYVLATRSSGSDEKDIPIVEISPASYPTCGKVYDACAKEGSCRERRLVGGEAADHSWPWMTEILVDDTYFCGGTLIAPGWILTAAHCLRQGKSLLSASVISVRTGHLNRFQPEATIQTKNVSHVILHPGFTESTFKDDIGLLHLEDELVVDRYTWPACLPSGALVVKGDAWLTGWGKTRTDLARSNLLQEVSLPMVPTEHCAAQNRDLFPTLNVNVETQLCAGDGKSSPGYACDGDSGGPLSWQGADKTWFVAGVTSWGDPTCRSDRSDTYTVFTRVSSYWKWIESHLTEEPSSLDKS